jgi:hypothetical protein
LILLNHAHLTAPASPYRASGPIFVREEAVPPASVIDALPGMLARRLLSLRAYDQAWMMVAAEVAQGVDIDAWLTARFRDPSVHVVHLHTARRGCYMAAAERFPS